MFPVFTPARKPMGRRSLLALSAAALVSACTPGPIGQSGPRIDTTAPVPVALLVPAGSGQATDELLARNLQNGARLAISDLGSVRIDLRVYNTAGQPQQAAAMATKAVDEGARIILGPVNSAEAAAASVAVAGRGINVISFSNNTEVAGGNLFVLGPTFRNTADRLSRFAVRQGKGRMMVVHEQTPAGEVGRQAITEGVKRAGGQVVATQGYAFSQTDIVNAAPSIAANARNAGAQALFMTADPAGALPLLTQLLRENGLDAGSATFVGLTRWDIPAATLALPGVQGGFFALPDPGLYQQYQARYQTAFGEPPHWMSGLAYDGIAAIGALVKQGNPNALTTAALTQGQGFVGVNGIFRLRKDGTNERGLAIATVQNGQMQIVDPAPRAFGGAGF